ncbi:MAG: UPF0175 family protein, partial [Candidatus Micrarchaeota archaeon]
NKQFYGFRLEEQLAKVVENVAKEIHSDKTHAITLLLEEGWENYRLKKALSMYGNGKVSLDKAAEIAGITVTEMMAEASQKNLGSTETIHEFNESLKKLLG